MRSKEILAVRRSAAPDGTVDVVTSLRGPKRGGDSPMMQQQQFSLEALAERDENKPFSKPDAPTAPTPATPAEPDDVAGKVPNREDEAPMEAVVDPAPLRLAQDAQSAAAPDLAAGIGRIGRLHLSDEQGPEPVEKSGRSLRRGPAKDDAALLKGLPKAKVAATWVPWTYGRLATASGYGAGVSSPGFARSARGHFTAG